MSERCSLSDQETCVRCDGTGTNWGRTCGRCGGDGHELVIDEAEVEAARRDPRVKAFLADAEQVAEQESSAAWFVKCATERQQQADDAAELVRLRAENERLREALRYFDRDHPLAVESPASSDETGATE